MTIKNNQGIQRLLNSMKKLIREVNDKEICNKLEILVSSDKEDINPALIDELLNDPISFNPAKIQEPYSQYVKHYIYMVKREMRIHQSKEKQKVEKEKKKSSSSKAKSKKSKS